jgi:hypothetical protein
VGRVTTIAVIVLAMTILPAAAASADGAKAMTEREKIEALIQAVEGMKGAKFVRNGAEYDGHAAADHMRRKWKQAADQVKTARDFIRLAASKSETSGKPYLIRFKDGREVESGKWLSARLEEIEKQGAAGRE